MEQVVNKNSEQEEKKVPNPEGKGGFGDNPENINRNGRPKNDISITYWMKEYLSGMEEGSDKERYKELAELICIMAASGNRHMIKEVLKRVDGEVPVDLNLTNRDLKEVASSLQEIYKAYDKSQKGSGAESVSKPIQEK